MAYHFRSSKHILLCGLGGCLGWLSYLLLRRFTGNDYMAGCFATVLVSLYSELAARILKVPATGFLVVTSIPMIPGASLYRTMHYLVLGMTGEFEAEGKYTILFASCMAAGFVTAGVLVKLGQLATAGDG